MKGDAVHFWSRTASPTDNTTDWGKPGHTEYDGRHWVVYQDKACRINWCYRWKWGDAILEETRISFMCMWKSKGQRMLSSNNHFEARRLLGHRQMGGNCYWKPVREQKARHLPRRWKSVPEVLTYLPNHRKNRCSRPKASQKVHQRERTWPRSRSRGWRA